MGGGPGGRKQYRDKEATKKQPEVRFEGWAENKGTQRTKTAAVRTPRGTNKKDSTRIKIHDVFLHRQQI